MPDIYNVYLDESCHLEKDGIAPMVLGSVWCPLNKTGQISKRIQEIKSKNRVPHDFEVKWTKVSPGGLELYSELIDYFFDDDDLHFRGVVIPDKSMLDHEQYNQNHHDWYYKMCFTLLEPIIDPDAHYRIYLDIKDTHSHQKGLKLREVLSNSRFDFGQQIVKRVQPIRSEESPILQIADLLIGAIGYKARNLQTSLAKLTLIERMENRTRGWPLDHTTWLRESKFNVLRWRSGGETP
ncbi:MAG: DUF3800 domain-containing protein [Planctomycetaceae bacterium]|nr:DUF3800 domain-containing protein [Planctomycetaceae bacterium]